MRETLTIYDQAVRISEDYLGPAGERFMRRQINVHLGIEPEKVQARHMPELISWIKLAYAVLTNNTRQVEEFANQLTALSYPSTDFKLSGVKKSKNGVAH